MKVAESLSTQSAAAAANWDLFGMAASILCIAHCVAMPLIIPFLISWGLVALSNESVHHTLLSVIMVLGVLAFIPGYKKHGQGMILTVATGGLASLFFGAFYAEEILGRAGETLFTVGGGALLVTAHWLNRRFCKQCPVCDETVRCCGENERVS